MDQDRVKQTLIVKHQSAHKKMCTDAEHVQKKTAMFVGGISIAIVVIFGGWWLTLEENLSNHAQKKDRLWSILTSRVQDLKEGLRSSSTDAGQNLLRQDTEEARQALQDAAEHEKALQETARRLQEIASSSLRDLQP